MSDYTFPSALEAYRRKQYLLAASISLLSLFMLFATHSFKSFLLFLPAIIYMFYLGFSLERKFNLGCIAEKVVSCESVRRSLMRNKTFITFLTTEDDQEHLRMVYPGTEIVGEMCPGSLYVIYYNTLFRNRLMAYVEV